MRIVFALTQSMESPYGVGRALLLAHALAMQGHDVHIVALHHNLPACTQRRYHDQGVTIHYAGQMHVRKVGDTTLYFGALPLLWVLLTATLGMAWTLLRLRPEVIHLGKPHPQNTIAGWLASRFPRRCVLLLDYDDLEAESNRTSGVLQRRMLGMLENRVPRLVDGVSVHSDFLAQRLLATGVDPARMHRLPSAVDLIRFGTPAMQDVERWRATLQAKGALVLYVGTLSLANHPVHLLLAAFALLRLRYPDVTLALAGGGKDIDLLRALSAGYGIADNCRFLGRVPAGEVPALYALADVTADPVFNDDTARARWPLKIIESLAAGVPVVTGDIGDRRQMLTLDDQIAGALVTPGDVEALATGLQKVLEGDAASLRARAQRAAARYAAPPIAANLARWYTIEQQRLARGSNLP